MLKMASMPTVWASDSSAQPSTTSRRPKRRAISSSICSRESDAAGASSAVIAATSTSWVGAPVDDEERELGRDRLGERHVGLPHSHLAGVALGGLRRDGGAGEREREGDLDGAVVLLVAVGPDRPGRGHARAPARLVRLACPGLQERVGVAPGPWPGRRRSRGRRPSRPPRVREDALGQSTRRGRGSATRARIASAPASTSRARRTIRPSGAESDLLGEVAGVRPERLRLVDGEPPVVEERRVEGLGQHPEEVDRLPGRDRGQREERVLLVAAEDVARSCAWWAACT